MMIYSKVDDSIPLFLSLLGSAGSSVADQMCLSSKYEAPFVSENGADLKLIYDICYADDVKQVFNSL